MESNEQRIPEDEPPRKPVCQGVHLSDFRIDPMFIVYSLGKSRPLITEFAYVFLRVSKCD